MQNAKYSRPLKFKGLIHALTLCTSVSTTVLGSNALASNELDYIWSNSSGSTSGTNILFILDSSASLLMAYKFYVSVVDPATNPSNSEAAKILAAQNTFRGQLKNTHIIPPSAFITNDQLHCPPEYQTMQEEGVYTACPVPLSDRWFLRELDIVRDVVRDLLPALTGQNVAFMRTSYNHKSFAAWTAAGRPSSANKRTDYPHPGNNVNGAYVISAFQTIDSNQSALDIAQKLQDRYIRLPGDSSQTPILESLYEAYLYYLGDASPWPKTLANEYKQREIDLIDPAAYVSGLNSNYDTPMTECTTNHIVMVSDGAPTYDWHANSQVSALTGGGVSPPTSGEISEDTLPEHTLIDEFTGFMANTDIDPNTPGKQTIMTHFISSWPTDASLGILDTAAASSGGFHVSLTDATQLHAKLSDLLDKIATGVSNPIIGYNVFTTNSSGNPFGNIDEAYVNVWEFKDGRWAGNLKKYALNSSGELTGKNGATIIGEAGLKADSISLWSNSADGEETIQGGSAVKLSATGNNRYSVPRNNSGNGTNIRQGNYTLRKNSNTFTPAQLGATGNAEKVKLLDWASGADVYDVDGDGNTTEVRQSLGDAINQKPIVAHYDKKNKTVFTGSNEGYLHAFNADKGDHLFSFMPHQLLRNAALFKGTDTEKSYGIDGQMSVWHNDKNNDNTINNNEKQMLFFGLGRGGSAVYALDITDQNSPKIAWSMDHQTSGFSKMGEAWGEVKATNIKGSNGDPAPIAIVTGGLNPVLRSSTAPLKEGNAIYIVDAYTGSKKWVISNSGADIIIPAMTHSIISKPITMDFNKDGLTDAFFINDIRGQIFRCDFKLQSGLSSLDCGKIAEAQPANGTLMFQNSLDVALVSGTSLNPSRKIILSMGSGNRFDPLSTETNRLVAFFDYNTNAAPQNYNYGTNGPITFSDLANAANASTETVHKLGWYFNFPGSQEKNYSQTLTYDNKIFLSTHEPGASTAIPCGPVDLGLAHIYGFDLTSGAPVSSTAGESQSHLIWTGPARGLPDTPYVATSSQSNAMQGSLNLGVDTTNLDLIVNPLSRSYWLQSK